MLRAGDSEVIIRLTIDKTIKLPKPSNKTYDRIYSIREALIYLPKYKGDGLYKLLEFLKDEGRLLFSRRTFSRHLIKFEQTGILPNENVLRGKPGRPRDKQTSELKELNNDDGGVANHSVYGGAVTMKKVAVAIRMKRLENDGHKAKDPSSQSIHNNSFLTVLTDERVSEVDSKWKSINTYFLSMSWKSMKAIA